VEKRPIGSAYHLGVVHGVGRGMGVSDGQRLTKGKGQLTFGG